MIAKKSALKSLVLDVQVFDCRGGALAPKNWTIC